MENEKPKKPKPQNKLIPLTHQGFRWLLNGLFPDCRMCVHAKVCPKYEPEPVNGCGIYRPLMEHRVRQILRLPWVKPYDIDTVRNYSKNITFLDVIDSYVEAVGGPLGVNGQVLPVLNKIRWTVENAATRQADKLLLTPAARAQAGVGRTKFADLEDVESYLLNAHSKTQRAVDPKDPAQ